MNVKELIEKLQKYPQDLEIVANQHGMEQSGILLLNLYPRVIRVKTEVVETRYAFDGTDYSYERYVKDLSGDKEVLELY